MAATINILFNLKGTVSGQNVSIGSATTPATITLSSDVYTDDTTTLATATTASLWQDGAATEHISQFAAAVITSTQDIFVELVCDLGNEVGDEKFCQKITANIPFIIPSSVAKANYDGAFGGTNDRIERIRARNESGSTAVIRLLLLK